ncbi:MAG: hypothetical protein Q9201_006953 [Fulgogasparrea decipioides]
MDLNRKATPTPHARTPQSPPRTPRAGTKRNSGMHRTPRDNFFDRLADNARGADGDDATPNSRISHDLSLTANIGRSSVVDNMLLSLNPDQPRLESPPDPTASRVCPTESPRSRGHIASSSLSSDYSFPSPPSNSRPSAHRPAHHPRGRRSNSSNFQSLSRIDSLTTDEEKVDTRRMKAYQQQRADVVGRTSIPASRSGGKSSKSSASSSVDFGQMMRQSALPRRSASFDDGRRRPSFPISNSFPQPAIHSNIEAAPTPTVPSGPRSPAILTPVPPQAAPSSKRSFRNPAAKRSKADVSNGAIGPKSDSFPDSQHMPASALQALRPASPAKDRNDVQDHHQRPPSQARDHAKDKPGFFRRVFKSSRNTQSTPQGAAFAQPPSSQNSVRAEAQAVMVPPSKLPKSSLSAEMTCPPKANAPLPLAKKSSSFFRRRKKSVSENISTSVPDSALHSDLHPPDPMMKHNASVSSLRELMNPYLSSSPDAGKGSVASSNDNASRMNRTPVEKSTVKAVFPYPAGDTSTSNVAQYARQVDDSKSKDAAGAKADVSLDDNLLCRDQSFLPDNSRNEKWLNRTLPPPATIADPSMLENPMSIHTTPGDLTSVKIEQSAQSSNAAVQSAQMVIEDGPKSKARKPRTMKMPRSRTVSGDKPSTSETAGQPAATTLNPAKETVIAAVTPSEATPRVWLRPERSTEDLRRLAETSLPDLDSQSSQAGDDRPSSSKRSRLTAAKTTAPELPTSESSDPKSPDFDATLPFREDRVLAQRIFEGDEGFVPKPKAAAWLGEAGPNRARVRRAYMELFDWQNLNILAALRDFCGRLLLKGETQQVDRILDAFSSRWCACNPNHGFKATGGVVYNLLIPFNVLMENTDVVHTICYSILLLNTDLHMADIEQKMTRAQFIKNTLPTIRRVAVDAAPDAFENKRASTLPSRKWAESPSGRSRSPSLPRNSSEGRRSYEGRRPSYRLSSRPSDQAAQVVRLSQSPTPLDCETAADDCGPLVKTPFHGKMSTWEVQIEIVLKDFFNSIRQQRLPLHKSEANEVAEPPPPASNSLSAVSNMLRRTPSMLSKAGSEHTSYRGRSTEPRFGTGRWTSKTRSRPRLYPSSTIGSSRTSLEDQSSTWTPSASSTWNKYSLSKTQTSMSVNSNLSNPPSNDYQQSIGFANALSQAIIREEGVVDPSEDTLRATPLLEDESLELAGAPWAKEGILKHKHHLEAMDKKARARNWVESFAVIEKGWMRLFSFNMNAKSLRQKAKHQKAAGGVVGGGNWMDSAEDLGRFLLRQTIASALPPPGYSKMRPHVWALSLPNGAVHLFQVGTSDIVKEFVTTANYWSARLSKEPLVGGISNVEYGWSDSVINPALLQPENRPPSNAGNARPSLQSSIRSSLDQGNVRPKLPGDRIVISDWTPPQQSMVASVLLEVDQLKALNTYVKNIEEELQKHNELRSLMLLAFSTRHPNSTKAMANWERKSSYLLREIVKFRTYIDCLQTAQAQKEDIYAKKKPHDEKDTATASEGKQVEQQEGVVPPAELLPT